MHRCLVHPDDWLKDRIPLPEAETHHLLRVVRVRTGERVGMFDGTGRDATARVEVDGAGRVFLRMTAPGEGTVPGADLRLIQAIPKGQRMDFLVEKCTELGVRAFVPVVTERTVARPGEAGADRRAARWRRIAEGAARQCGLSLVPEVQPVRTLVEALALETDRGAFLMGSLRDDARPLQETLADLGSRDGTRRITVLIGPEGDLTDREMALAAAHGALPVTFGPLILRVETAAIFAAAVISYEFRRRRTAASDHRPPPIPGLSSPA